MLQTQECQGLILVLRIVLSIDTDKGLVRFRGVCFVGAFFVCFLIEMAQACID